MDACIGPFQTQTLPVSVIPDTTLDCYTRIRDRRGIINTPYYNGTYRTPYPNNLDCVYEFVRYFP